MSVRPVRFALTLVMSGLGCASAGADADADDEDVSGTETDVENACDERFDAKHLCKHDGKALVVSIDQSR